MPGLTPRRLIIGLGLLAIGGSATLAVLAGLGVVPPTIAAILAGAGTILAALLILLIGIRRVDAKVQKMLHEHRRHASSTDTARQLTRLADRADAVLADVRDVVRDLQGALGEDRVDTAAALAETERHLDRALAELSRTMRAPIDEVDARLRRVEAGVEALPGRVDALGATVTGLPDKFASRVTADARRSYERLEAYVDLRQLIRPRAPLPGLSGWAADPHVLRVVFEALWRDRPDLIVECGSGSSSVWLGYAVEHVGTGRVVALEHDERYLALSRDLVRAHGLDDVVEIRHAPLEAWRPAGEADVAPPAAAADAPGAVTAGSDTAVDPGAPEPGAATDPDAAPRSAAATGEPVPTGEAAQRAPAGHEYPWYAHRAVEDLSDIGVLFVDGPPGAAGPQARYPALPLLLPRCAPRATIVLDDAHRTDESALSDRWLAEFPELERTTRGPRVHVFTRRPT